MKKKILSLGIVAVLIVMLVTLTGCGEKETTNENQKNPIENSETATTQQNNEGVNISKVISAFSNGYAFVQGEDGIYYIIDEKGNSTYEINNYNEETTTFSNGYLSINESKKNYVLDNTGKEILSSENKTYGAVSKSGYISVVTKEESIAGIKMILTIEDLKGNIIYTGKAQNRYDSKYIGEDVYCIDGDGILINAKTGTTYSYDKGINNTFSQVNDTWIHQESYYGKYITYDLKTEVSDEANYEETTAKLNIISGSNKYLFGTTTAYSNKAGVFDYNGKLIKNFEDLGGIHAMFEYNDVLYVVSETRYVYTMDTDLNIIAEPQTDRYSSIVGSTSKGIIAFNKISNEYVAIDKDLNEISKFENLNKLSQYTLETDIDNKFIYGVSREDFNRKAIYSVETQDILKIYK